MTVYRKAGRATIKEVASQAGVSTQTVSRVINERPDVSPETRERVREIIDRLGYQPSALARSLISQRSYTLGVVIAGLKYTGPSRTLSGITGAAEEADYSLILKELHRFDTQDVAPIFHALISRHVDGIIWAVPEIGENRDWIVHQAPDLNIPIIFLTQKTQPGISIVSMDNYTGGRMAMAHLLEKGYRHIGHISGPLDWWESQQRYRAWKDSLTEAGLVDGDEHWVEGNWSSTSGAQAIEKLWGQYPDMDAVFVANDQMALSVVQHACKTSRRIPDDLGVVGFDNIPESAFFWPALTTIQQDQYNLGKTAVEETIRIIEAIRQDENPPEPKSILLTPTLVVRQSTTRPKEVTPE
jgi:LacI family transcriptional regulator